MSERVISDILDLVAAVELTDLVVHEERARRIHWDENQAPDDVVSETNMGLRVSDNELGYRFKITVADSVAEYVADFEAIYTIEGEPAQVDDEVMMDFARRVAFMAVYPYLRTSIFAAAGRLQAPAPIMGIVRQGDFSAGERMSADSAQRTFNDVTSTLVHAITD
jgi:hypothetical protein